MKRQNVLLNLMLCLCLVFFMGCPNANDLSNQDNPSSGTTHSEPSKKPEDKRPVDKEPEDKNPKDKDPNNQDFEPSDETSNDEKTKQDSGDTDQDEGEPEGGTGAPDTDPPPPPDEDIHPPDEPGIPEPPIDPEEEKRKKERKEFGKKYYTELCKLYYSTNCCGKGSSYAKMGYGSDEKSCIAAYTALKVDREGHPFYWHNEDDLRRSSKNLQFDPSEAKNCLSNAKSWARNGCASPFEFFRECRHAWRAKGQLNDNCTTTEDCVSGYTCKSPMESYGPIRSIGVALKGRCVKKQSNLQKGVACTIGYGECAKELFCQKKKDPKYPKVQRGVPGTCATPLKKKEDCVVGYKMCGKLLYCKSKTGPKANGARVKGEAGTCTEFTGESCLNDAQCIASQSAVCVKIYAKPYCHDRARFGQKCKYPGDPKKGTKDVFIPCEPTLYCGDKGTCISLLSAGKCK